jgi:thiamine biosynthesis lipoprotein
MHSFSRLKPVERATALLGTYVAARVSARSAHAAHAAIDRAFEAMTEVHRLMSFHEDPSDVSRLNREAVRTAVRVHPQTVHVLRWAARLARLSAGAFDISVGGRLVECGMLPAPPTDLHPDPAASYRDIELLPGQRVRFHRPLWIDLGGIAKGFAVDRGIATLRACGVTRATINAGGDLRILGRGTERVCLRTAEGHAQARATIELRGSAAVATSSGATTQRPRTRVEDECQASAARAPTVDPCVTSSVVAPTCLIADALTKIILIRRATAASLLRSLRAEAYVHDPGAAGSQWNAIGVSP